ncbi:MAG TPA: DUF559 domain-containing protein [Acidimicrobiales bacterium]|nr:DUF559 domain-containing protein [Acidimicrobiales bacterium]
MSSSELLDEAIDAALAQRLVNVDGLLAEVARLRRRGRRGPAQLMARLDGRGFVGASSPSVLESRALRVLAAGKVKVDRCEVVVNNGRYRLDIQVGPQLFVEVDGYAYHWAPEQKHYDDQRRNKLRLLGFEILVYDWRAIVSEPRRVLKDVKTALRAQAAARRSRDHHVLRNRNTDSYRRSSACSNQIMVLSARAAASPPTEWVDGSSPTA